jgi:hypothetical protein
MRVGRFEDKCERLLVGMDSAVDIQLRIPYLSGLCKAIKRFDNCNTEPKKRAAVKRTKAKASDKQQTLDKVFRANANANAGADAMH